MKFADPLELEDTLVRLSLVTAADLKAVHARIGRTLTVPDLLLELERSGLLTGYQVSRLSKGETEGLRLGAYKLLYQNAAGSFARVFRASTIGTGQLVGIKLLRQRHAQDPRIVQLFFREAELGKRLKHRNIVPIYDVASEGQQHYMTMEFVEGGNFKDFLKIRRKFAPAEATKFILDIAEGLNYALTLGYTHRDLKLTNVLLSSSGVAKLVDFGLAGKETSAGSDEVDRAVEYAAIEKAAGAPENDPRSDLYFLGAMFYELLTGQPPYPPTRDRDERKQISRYRNVRSIRTVDPTLPLPVVDMVTRLMQINPHERYQSAAELIVDLRAFLGETVPAAPAAEPAPASPPTILCVESRLKQQDALREYFGKHGWRVLVMTTPERALTRLKQGHVHALVLMGETAGDELVQVHQQALAACEKSGTAAVVVLSKKQGTLADLLPSAEVCSVLVQPVTLRDIRSAVEKIGGFKPVRPDHRDESE